MIVDLAPWEAKSLAMSTIGIWWPPPPEGKKNISTVRVFESMDALTFERV